MFAPRIGHTALTWSVFNGTANSNPLNLAEAIKDVSELGYGGTETGGAMYDWWEKERPGELKRILNDNGVVMACLFQFGNWTEPEAGEALLEDARRWSAALPELGGGMLMLVPGHRREYPPYGLDEFRQMAATMNQVGEIAKAAGISTTMHPHWGTVAETRLEIELLLSLLDDGLVGFAPDTGQIAKGGADPMPVIDRWAERVGHVHLKDLTAEWEDMRKRGVPLPSPEGYTELGQGTIDLRRLMPILERVGFTGWLMAELDVAKRPAREAATLSKRYLEEMLGLKLRR